MKTCNRGSEYTLTHMPCGRSLTHICVVRKCNYLSSSGALRGVIRPALLCQGDKGCGAARREGGPEALVTHAHHKVTL